ncbi:MAG: indolepyruvate ferredoxin oxidoreductase subunit alpha [Deltaproteobacteria bacterium]|nr:indolepyruvate ferredoxin oxidoreductase subunit alpha [Deltaproteobacteria bacterium]
MNELLLSPEAGGPHLLLGNEAIVRGALEAGVGFVSCYPGTPSSEVPDTFFRLSPKAGYSFEYSVNEKVAMEVAGGAALAGVPSLVTMKHVGVNVAADPMMTLAYIGTPGGLVILSADDPGCHSSQNEQDNRIYARLGGLPCFEPASAQEAKDMTREALVLSARLGQPVLLRTTTRVNHLRGPVIFEALPEARSKGRFVKTPGRFVPIPAVARTRHPALLSALTDMKNENESSSWNIRHGQGRIGFISSGISRAYLADALEGLGNPQVQVLELGQSYPLPASLILDFLRHVDLAVIVEELEPVMETEIRALAQEHGLAVKIMGKGPRLPRTGEYSVRIVIAAVRQALGMPDPEESICSAEPNLPMRPPNLCAGCPHRAAYYAVRQVYGDEAVYSSDIGCYTLGILPPLKTADFLLCMGSSISAGSGAARAGSDPVVAFIGDSTFFHSGVTGLINAVHNEHDILLVILDNRTTAMTGHQPHPGVDQTAIGPNPRPVDIEKIVIACGVEHIRVVKPLNYKATVKALEELKALSGVRVLIAKDPCTLFARRILGRKPGQVAYVVPGREKDCLPLARDLACPAFFVHDGGLGIDPLICAGCMLCVQVGEHIKAKSRS